MYSHILCPQRAPANPANPATPARPDVHIVPIVSGGKLELDDAELSRAAHAALRRPEAGGDVGQVVMADVDGGRLVLLGLGEPAPLDADAVRVAAWHLLRALHAIGARRAHWHSPAATPTLGDAGELARVLAQGLELSRFRFDTYKQPPATAGPRGKLTLSTDDAPTRRQLQAGLALAASINHARELAAQPPNVATPDYLAAHARALARKHELRCTVYRGEQLRKRRLVGLETVGRASEHKPCLIELVHQPARPRATVVLVGKAITFDAGGLSLKINDTMRHMKYDKAAGCAVLGAMHAVARLKPNVRVVGLLPAAENAVSDQAYRVDDILRFPNGVSVEVTNTDYEGRLVLADGLIHACKQYKPDALIDLGTLTGEIIQGLAGRTAGLWCDDAPLRERLLTAGERAGEPVWPMPLTREHREAIVSPHADVVNLALDEPGKPGQCAAFLERFVTPGVAWAHLDIAGPVHVTAERPPFAVGPTGYGAGLLAELIAGWG
ncbi:MAG: leucyl aminopeptidase family protein [Phycisphaeraceae bacterium]